MEPSRAHNAVRPSVARLTVSGVLLIVVRRDEVAQGGFSSPTFAGLGEQARLDYRAVHVASPITLVACMERGRGWEGVIRTRRSSGCVDRVIEQPC